MTQPTLRKRGHATAGLPLHKPTFSANYTGTVAPTAPLTKWAHLSAAGSGRSTWAEPQAAITATDYGT
jgi:hypothetical protein